MTKVELELLTDIEMLDMVEERIRGGISSIINRHAKANNKDMGKDFNPENPSKYLVYLDANNLYGWAISMPLPTKGFKWMTKEELQDWKNHTCILEVDLEYPEELHDLHNEYPLAPERLEINKVKKIIPNLNNKTSYVLHYENLKLYESLGMKVTENHRGIKFEESPWLKEYIDKNTSLRAKAKNEFEKDFFKLMNNAVVDVKGGFQDKLHSMTPPKTLIWEMHSMTPLQGKRVHSLTPSLKKISPRIKKIENQFKEI